MAKDSSTGLDEKLGGVLAYAFGWISGLIIYLIEKKNKTIRYHAMQSIVVFGGLQIFSIAIAVIPILGWILSALASLTGIVLWIYLMIAAFQGKKPKIPIAGKIAEQYA